MMSKTTLIICLGLVFLGGYALGHRTGGHKAASSEKSGAAIPSAPKTARPGASSSIPGRSDDANEDKSGQAQEARVSSGQLRSLRERFVLLGQGQGRDALKNLASLRGLEREQALLGIVEGWSKSDLDACAAWVASDREYLNDINRMPALREVCLRMAESSGNMAKAGAFIGTLPTSEMQEAASRTLAYAAIKNGLPVDAAWLAALSTKQERFSAVDGISAALVEDDPRRAIDWAINQCPDGEKGRALTRVLADWSARDGVDSPEQWLEQNMAQLTDSQIDTAFTAIGRNKAFQTPEEAIKVLSLIQDPVKRDNAFRSEVRAFASSNPDVAFEMALRISDPAYRLQTLQRTVRLMGKQDVNLALGKVQSSTLLSAAEKAKLLGLVKTIKPKSTGG
jgi:hypothetical protein